MLSFFSSFLAGATFAVELEAKKLLRSLERADSACLASLVGIVNIGVATLPFCVDDCGLKVFAASSSSACPDSWLMAAAMP